MIQTRPALPSDLRNLNDLLKASKAHWGYDEVFMKEFMENLGLSEASFSQQSLFLVFVEGVLAGFYGFAVGEDKILELEHFYLYPDFIGKGLGRQMWNLGLDTAKSWGHRDFLVWSDPHADGFYEKMGGKLVRFQRSSLGQDRYQAVFRMVLEHCLPMKK
ncbi:MAG: GNAT family N-acetyltransferase [Alphaproteobacteria bacterium]